MLVRAALFSLTCLPLPPAAVLPGPVIEPFEMPACARCAGHRGVVVSVPQGRSVRAGHGGTLTFNGSVAGRRFVVIRTGQGLLLTYGDVVPSPDLPGRGVDVERGTVLGTSAGRVYVGVRDRGLPVHPRVLFSVQGSRLVPPARLRCPVSAPPGPL